MKKKQFDWGNVYKALVPVLDHSASLEGNANISFQLEDTRTIAMGGGRQVGLTSWAIRELVKDDNAILISLDRTHRLQHVLQFKELYGNGGALKARRKFFTATDFESMDEALLSKILKKTKRVFIDDAGANHRCGMVYNYLAEHVDAKSVIIVKMGV